MAPSELTAEAWLHEAAQLRPLVRALVRDDHLAEDVLQETWIAASRSPVVSGLEHPAQRSWLRTVARRLAAKAMRRDRRSADLEEQAARPELLTPDERPEVLDELRMVLEELRDMPQSAREAVCLRYLDGLEPGEIARRMDCPPSTARVRVHRGLADLRERLKKRFGGKSNAAFALLLRWSENGPRTAGPIGGPGQAATVASGEKISGAQWTLGLASLAGIGLITVQLLQDPAPAVSDGPSASRSTTVAELTAVQPQQPNSSELTTRAAAPAVSSAVDPAAPVQVTVGVVYAESRRPIPGAELVGFVDLIDGSARPFAATTDQEGVARLSIDLNQTVALALEATAEGREPEYLVLRGTRLNRGPDRLRSIPMALGRSIGGSVVDEAGRGVEGARVVLHRKREDLARTRHFPDAPNLVATTDANGVWSFATVDLGATIDDDFAALLQITAEHPDHAPFEFSASRSGSRAGSLSRRLQSHSLKIVLPSTDGPSLQVLGPNGEPIPGALVTDLRPAARAVGEEIGARTDSAGRAILPSAAARVDLRIDAPGWAAVVLAADERPRAPWTVTLDRGVDLVGRVVDRTGAPVAAARIRPGLWEGKAELKPPIASGEDGTFRLANLPGHSIQLLVNSDDYLQSSWRGAAGDGPIEIVLDRKQLVTGRVATLSGEPIPRAQVELRALDSDAWVLLRDPTDQAGAFSGSPKIVRQPRSFELRAVASGYRSLAPLAVNAGDPVTNLDLRMAPAEDVEVTVRDHNGDPVVGSEVSLWNDGPGPLNPMAGFNRLGAIVRVNTDERGIAHLPRRDGEVCIVASDDEHFGHVTADLAGAEPIELTAPAMGTLRFNLGPDVGPMVRLRFEVDGGINLSPRSLAASADSDSIGPVELLVPPSRGVLTVEVLGERATHGEAVRAINSDRLRRRYEVDRRIAVEFAIEPGQVLDLESL